MALLLSSILTLDVFKNCKILAGESALDNEVSYITVMDVPDIATWLHGGEVVLAAKLFDSSLSSTFLYELKKKNCSAIITKQLYTQKLTPALKEQCNILGMPIIEVAPEVSWGDITNPVTDLIVKEQQQYIYQSQSFHSALMKFMIKGHSLNELCDDIYNNFSMTFALTDRYFSLLAASSNFEWNRIIGNFDLQNAFFSTSLGKNVTGDGVLTGYVYTSLFLESKSKKVIIVPITQSGVIQGYIFYLVDENLEELPVYETMCLDKLSLIFSLTIAKEREFNTSLQQYNNLLLEKLLEMNHPSDEDITYLESSLKISFKTKHHIALANRDISSAMSSHSIHVQHLFDLIHRDPLLKNTMCFDRGESLVFLIPESQTDLREILSKLYSLSHQHVLTTLIVASDPTNTEYQSAYAQVNRAFNYFSESKGNGYYTLSDLGIIRLFLDEKGHINHQYLDDLVNRYVTPLVDYDKQRKSHLAETIKAYFTNNKDISATSSALFIHKNTLYQRLSKAEELLQCDMSLSEDCFGIQLAFKVYEAIAFLD